jgi:hypothetical protein
MNVSLKAMCRRRDVLRVFSYDERSKDAAESSPSGTDRTSAVDTYLLRPYDSCPIALGAFLVPHFGFRSPSPTPAVAVRVSFGGL